MSTPFFHRLDRIDEIINKGPQACSFERQVRPLLEEEASFRYFYEHICDPAWLDVLKAAGEFVSPPEPEHDRDRGTTNHPLWWPGKCLVALARRVPEKVRDIVLEMPPTRNFRVHNCVVDAACLMPPSVGAAIAARLMSWLELSQRVWLSEGYASLIVHLAEGREGETALRLARALLTVLPHPRTTTEEHSEALGKPNEPRALMDNWQYKTTLEKVVPVLVKCTHLEALAMFCALLDEAAKLMKRPEEDGTRSESIWGWPPAIEDHEQNRTYDSPKDVLVFAVRDASEMLITKEGTMVLEAVESPRYNIFARIGLHLRRGWPDVDMIGTNALLSDPGIYQESVLHHELFHLVRVVFPKLSPEALAAFFQHVERGMNVEQFKKSFRSWRSEEPTSEDIERAVRRFRFGELVPVKEYLTGEWKERYAKLSEEFEVRDHPDFLSYIDVSNWAPPEPPKKRSELAAMAVQDLVEYLREVEPSNDPEPGILEGLGIEVSALVQAAPEKYMDEARHFQDCHPEIVIHFLSGVSNLIRSEREFDRALWKPVLNLCKWVVDEPRDAPVRKGRHADLDPGWGWTRKEIADVVQEGLKSESTLIPLSFRELVWSVLLPLTDDPDPSADRENEGGNPYDLALNAVRGRAVSAIVQYALWVHRNVEKQPDGPQEVEKGFDLMPEVRQALDKHLDTSVDPSLAIRAVYGQWFPWLVLLDREWAKVAKDRIFTEHPQLQHFFDAAWETYVMFCRPYNNVWPVLRDRYEHAVQRIGKWDKERHRPADPDECLMNHLMTFYWRGIIELEDPILRGAYSIASGGLRGHAMDFMGRSLQEAPKEGIQPDTRSRLEAFWEWRLGFAKQSPSDESCKEELVSYGSWFVSGKLDDSWSLRQLADALEIATWAEPDHLVLRRLAELSKDSPSQAVECLSMMVEGDQEGWNIGRWDESTRVILSNAISLGDPSTRNKALALVHRLGSLGHLEYRDLLPREGEE